MPIISVSLNDNILSEIELMQRIMGFSARSEIIRAAIKNLISEEKQKIHSSSIGHAILIVTHDESSEQIVTTIKHHYEDLIRTHLHNKVKNNKCMELFLLHGNTEKMDIMTKDFKLNKKIENVKFVFM